MVNFVIAEGMLSEMPTKAEGKILMVVTEDCVVPVGKMAMLSDIKIEQVETLDPILLSNLIVEKATENGERDICVHTNNQDVEKLFTKRQVKINGFTFHFEAKQLGKAGRKTKEMPAARKANKDRVHCVNLRDFHRDPGIPAEYVAGTVGTLLVRSGGDGGFMFRSHNQPHLRAAETVGDLSQGG